jgi:hypothetical protein
LQQLRCDHIAYLGAAVTLATRTRPVGILIAIVLARCAPPQVYQLVSQFVAVAVAALMAVWTRPDERLHNKTVDR